MNEFFPFSKRRRDDRRPCRLRADHWPRVSHVLCRLGVRKMAPDCLDRLRAGHYFARPAGILVVLFIYFGSSQLLLTLSDGFTLHLGFTQIPVQMEIETLTSVRSCAA
ncbi:arginine transporter permease subunit ArtQ, partial [Salmonella enterica subsp. enterica serovar Enteritidis str. 22558]